MNANTVVDLAWLESATLNDLKAAMRIGGATLMAVNALLLTPEGKEIAQEMINDPDYIPKSKRPVDPEEAAQRAADIARADAQALVDAAAPAPAVAATTAEVEAATAAATAEAAAEVAELEKAGIVLHKDAQGRVVRIVQDYQVKGEDGVAIGRPTHLESKSWAEHVLKQKAAHENAVRYAERVKKSRVQDVQSQTQQRDAQQKVKQSQEEADAAVAEATKDTSKLPEAIRKVTKAERDAEEAANAAREAGRVIGQRWMADHSHDFLPCDANSKIIGDWLKENNREFSYDNLELAFTATETRLAKPEAAPVVEVPAAVALNAPAAATAATAAATPSITAPAAAATVPASTAAPSTSQPTATATAPTPVAATNTPATRRPGVNGSLPPGSLSAQRPSTSATPVASDRAALLKEINSLPRGEFAKKLKDANYVKRLEAAGIPVAGHRG